MVPSSPANSPCLPKTLSDRTIPEGRWSHRPGGTRHNSRGHRPRNGLENMIPPRQGREGAIHPHGILRIPNPQDPGNGGIPVGKALPQNRIEFRLSRVQGIGRVSRALSGAPYGIHRVPGAVPPAHLFRPSGTMKGERNAGPAIPFQYFILTPTNGEKSADADVNPARIPASHCRVSVCNQVIPALK